MALSLLAKAKQYFTSKSQDNEGWLRQGKFTPGRQISSQINYQKQNSPINRALYTGIETAGRPVVNSLANIGALGTTALGSAQMAFNKPQAAQRSFNTALNLRNFAGTQGSFDQGTGWNTIKKGGIDAIQTALTGKGLKYVNPVNLGISGLLSGGASKLSGGDFATGVGQGMGATPSIMGFVGASNPILSKVLGGKLSPLMSGKVGSRLTPAIANVAQGVGLDLARGTPTTLKSMGLDLATGLAGGKGQFDMGTNFSMPRNTMDEVIKAEDMLLNPQKYLEKTISVTKKNANSIRNVQIKKIQEEAARVIDQISAKYLPNEVLKNTAGNVKAQIRALVDLSGQNKLANVNYLTDKSQPIKTGTPEVGGIAKLIEDTKVKRLQVLKDIESLKSKSPMSQSIELPKLQKKLDMYESFLTNLTGNPEGWRGGAQLNEMESPLSPIKTGGEGVDLDSKFTHNKWFIGGQKTKREALDEFAKSGDFYTEGKLAKVQSNYLMDDPIYDGNVLKYKGKEGGSYRLSDEELKYFQERQDYWTKQKNAEKIKLENDPVEIEKKLNRKKFILEDNIRSRKGGLESAIKEGNQERISFWKNELEDGQKKLNEFLKSNRLDKIEPIKTGGEGIKIKPSEKIKIKSTESDISQTPILNPNRLQSDPLLSSPESQILTDQKSPVIKVKTPPPSDDIIPQGKQRGLITSAKESSNLSGPTQENIQGTYIPKTNTKLMGEAKALLNEGVTIDFKNTEGLDKKVAATIQEAINLDKAGDHEAAANLFNNLSKHATELGRGVHAFSLLNEMSPEAVSLSASKLIKNYNLTSTKKIPELTGDQVKLISDKVKLVDLLKRNGATTREVNSAINDVSEVVNNFIPSSFTDKFITVWKAGLLTSLRTHERNIVGNTIHGTMEIIKDIPASGADMLMSTKTGQRSMSFTAHGVEDFASKSTGQQMADVVAKGVDLNEPPKFDYKRINWGTGRIGKFFKGYTDSVFRVLEAADKPFYNAAMSRSLYDQAGTAAINAGKRGDMSFIKNLVENPTEDMIKIALGDANTATFKTKNMATSVANGIKRSMGDQWYGKLAAEITMPFTGVPSSILGQIQAYSPVGLIKGAIDVGRVTAGQVPELQRQAAQELGRGVVGTGIYSLGAYLMSKGLITGQPKDAEEARLWDSQNKPRNSIFINGKWRSLNSIGPESVVLLAGAKLNEELNKPDGSLANYGVSLGKDYLDQSFVQGLQGPVNAITDPARYSKSYLGSLVSSPIPNIVKDLSRATDDYQRETNTVTDYAKSGIPILRKTLIPKRDVLGNIMLQEPSGDAAGLDLFNSKTPISNPVINELERLYNIGSGATPSKLTPSQTILKQKVKLTYEQLNNLEAGVGEMLRPKLEKLIADPNYQRLDDEAKSSAIDKLVKDTRLKYKNVNASSILSGKSATNSPQINTTVSGGYLDSSGNYKQVDTTPIPEPKYTGNSVIDKKLKTQYENAIIKQQTELAKSGQTQTSDESKVFSYIDEDGDYKTVDLTPIEYPKLTGNTVVDKKLKSSYYSAINSQINDVIKLGKSGQITEEEMIQMVNSLSEQSKSGKKSTKSKGGKITIAKTPEPKVIKFKLPTIKLPTNTLKSNIKIKKPSIAQLKKRRTIKIKV